MKIRIIIVFLHVLLCNSSMILYPQTVSSVFPDKEVKSLAIMFDSIYFSKFIESLNCINSNDTSLIDFFFNESFDTISKNYSSVDIKEYKSSILLLYKYSNFADYPISFPLNWTDNIHSDITWKLYYQSLSWLNPYLKSSNLEHNIAAFQVINDWIISNNTYPAKENQFAFDDHAIADRLVILQTAYSKFLSLEIIDNDFLIDIRLSLLSHIFFIASLEKYMSGHNHAIIFDQNLITALLSLNDFKFRTDFLNLAFQRIFEQYRYSFTTEGIHKEHSPCYHFDFTRRLGSTILQAKDIDVIIPADITKLYENATNYNRYLKIGGLNLKIGDCVYSKPINSSKNTSKYDSAILLTRDSSLCISKFKVFPYSGWAFAFDTVLNINIVMQSDFNSFSHYQQDETSFILNIGDDELIIDPGLHSYNKGEIYDFYRSARAHNLLLVDDKDFEPDFRNNTGLSGIVRHYSGTLSNNSEVAVVEMTHPHYKNMGVNIYRQFFFPGAHNITIKDFAYSEQERKYSQLFHLAPDAFIEKNASGFLVSWPHHPFKLKFITNEESYEIIAGQLEPLQGWYFPAMNQKLPAPVLVLNKFAKDLEFSTTIEIIFPDNYLFISDITENNMRELLSIIGSLDRRTLLHQPTPAKWKPNRR